MVSNIEHLAGKFVAKLQPKVASRRGTRMNTKKILRELDKARKVYKESRAKLRALEAELEQIEGGIQECRDGVRGSRSQMLKMNKILQNMDLADAKYAVFYDNDSADVGYIIGSDEHYLDIGDDGEITITPMSEYRKRLRAERHSDDEVEPEEDEYEPYEDYEDDEEDESEEESEDNNDTDDDFIAHLNLRFAD